MSNTFAGNLTSVAFVALVPVAVVIDWQKRHEDNATQLSCELNGCALNFALPCSMPLSKKFSRRNCEKRVKNLLQQGPLL